MARYVKFFSLGGSGGGLGPGFVAGTCDTIEPTSYIQAIDILGGPDANIALIPTGNGAIIAACPDATALGGDVRGINAVDFQVSRTLATQVAYGDYSVITGGINNTASGNYSGVLFIPPVITL